MSPIDATRVSLERTVGSLENLLAWWTLLVAVGLMMEYGAEAAKLSWDKREPTKKKRLTEQFLWIQVFILVGALFITAGVAGELYVEAALSVAASNLRNHDNKAVATLNAETAKLTSDNLTLRAAIADRDLTLEQQQKIHEASRKFSGKTVYMRSYPNDHEAARLILEIEATLDPTLKVEDRTGQMLFGGPLILGIRIEPSRDDGELADALVKTFRRDGALSVEDLSPLGADSSPTEILVGLKPVALAREIAGRIESRHLAVEQQKRITAKLLPFTGERFNLFGYGSDSEIVELANEFLFACCNQTKGAGWVESVSAVPIGEITGVLVLVKPTANEKERKAADTLVSALRSEHLTVTGPREAPDHRAAVGIVPGQPLTGMIDPSNPITMVIGKLPRFAERDGLSRHPQR